MLLQPSASLALEKRKKGNKSCLLPRMDGWMDTDGRADGRMNDEGREWLFMMDWGAFFPTVNGWMEKWKDGKMDG